jgi:hypothetical protein
MRRRTTWTGYGFGYDHSPPSLCRSKAERELWMANITQKDPSLVTALRRIAVEMTIEWEDESEPTKTVVDAATGKLEIKHQTVADAELCGDRWGVNVCMLPAGHSAQRLHKSPENAQW